MSKLNVIVTTLSFVLGGLLGLGLVRLSKSAEIKQQEFQSTFQAPVSKTTTEDVYISTVKHDGHLFVMAGRYSTSSALHHPDCPCEVAK